MQCRNAGYWSILSYMWSFVLISWAWLPVRSEDIGRFVVVFVNGIVELSLSLTCDTMMQWESILLINLVKNVDVSAGGCLPVRPLRMSSDVVTPVLLHLLLSSTKISRSSNARKKTDDQNRTGTISSLALTSPTICWRYNAPVWDILWSNGAVLCTTIRTLNAFGILLFVEFQTGTVYAVRLSVFRLWLLW